MVRRSTLVYDLLRTDQSEEGFTEKEIVEHISNKHDITAGKGLRKQVAVALRRGVDFGILAKKNNKFRFDPDYILTTLARSTVRKRKQTRKGRKRSTSTKTSSKRRKVPVKSRARSSSVPRPKVPKPPSWTPKRKNLAEEPVPKVKKVP